MYKAWLNFCVSLNDSKKKNDIHTTYVKLRPDYNKMIYSSHSI